MPPSEVRPQEQDRPARRRAAWALVTIMSLLLMLAFVAVVWGFLRQGRLYMAGRAAQGQGAGLTLPPGAHIISSSTDSGRLVLRLATPQGERVQIIDLASGKLVREIKSAP